MKVLLVNGSPHKEGCTYTALAEVGASLNQSGIGTDVFWIGNKPLSGCIACKSCIQKNRCVFDDTVNEFLELAGGYDGFVFGTPVHWGGAAGGRMAAYLGSYGPEAFGGGDLPRPGAVIMQYTGHSEYTESDPPTYACVGTSDGIASWRTMERRLEALEAQGIPTEFHTYEGLGHGFGLGAGTVAEGWIKDAVAFWESQFVTPGTETYRGFSVDNVLHSGTNGDIHYNVYIPESYDGSKPYALYFTLPGYEGLYFQGVASNIKSESSGFEAQKYNEEMIVVAPQLNDWGETSANQMIALAEYFLKHYNIDPARVYANGYSGGGETMSIVMGKRPELFTAYLHCSSQWDGDYSVLAESRTPSTWLSGKTMNTTVPSLPRKPTTRSMDCTRSRACQREKLTGC